jgi:hypothetical protein
MFEWDNDTNLGEYQISVEKFNFWSDVAPLHHIGSMNGRFQQARLLKTNPTKKNMVIKLTDLALTPIENVLQFPNTLTETAYFESLDNYLFVNTSDGYNAAKIICQKLIQIHVIFYGVHTKR